MGAAWQNALWIAEPPRTMAVSYRWKKVVRGDNEVTGVHTARSLLRCHWSRPQINYFCIFVGRARMDFCGTTYISSYSIVCKYIHFVVWNVYIYNQRATVFFFLKTRCFFMKTVFCKLLILLPNLSSPQKLDYTALFYL